MRNLTIVAAWLLEITRTWIAPSTPAEEALRPEIARDLVTVAFDPWETPLFPAFRGTPLTPFAARALTALQGAAIVRFESDFRVEVDDGRKRGRAGDVCGMQIVVPPGKRGHLSADLYRWVSRTDPAFERAWAANDLVPGGRAIDGEHDTPRQRCYRLGLHMMRESFRACRSLSMYVQGDCRPNAKARHRELLARETFRRFPSPSESE